MFKQNILSSPEVVAKKPFIMVCGNCGTGKTSASNFLHKHLDDFCKLSMDEVRNSMGITEYRKEDGHLIVDEMDRLARLSLNVGQGVISDRPHQTFRSRDVVYASARASNTQVLIIECVCPEEVSKQRIESRPKQFNSNVGSVDRIKSSWQDVALDFEIDKTLDGFVSYIRYDTISSIVQEFRVTDALKDLTSKIGNMLEYFKG